MPSLRVLIVDDHRAFGEALAARLAQEPDIHVVGTATNGAQARQLARALHPDVVTVDLDLAGEDGIGVIPQLLELAPAPSVVMVSASHDGSAVVRAVRAGATSWVAKDAAIDDLINAVRGSARGESHVTPGVLSFLLRELAAGKAQLADPGDVLARLTKREGQVLRCLVGGLDRPAVAGVLFLSPNTVRTHIQNLLAKLSVHSTLEAAALGRRCGVAPWKA